MTIFLKCEGSLDVASAARTRFPPLSDRMISAGCVAQPTSNLAHPEGAKPKTASDISLLENVAFPFSPRFFAPMRRRSPRRRAYLLIFTCPAMLPIMYGRVALPAAPSLASSLAGPDNKQATMSPPHQLLFSPNHLYANNSFVYVMWDSGLAWGCQGIAFLLIR